jgi:signal transduction histidine kinase
LLDNVLKYAADGGELIVEIDRQDHCCRIAVKDRGPGIPVPHQERIFESFHRVDDTLTASRPGSGLGLSIARQLLRGMGGDLRYRPRSSGGSCFEMLLPISPAGPDSPPGCDKSSATT